MTGVTMSVVFLTLILYSLGSCDSDVTTDITLPNGIPETSGYIRKPREISDQSEGFDRSPLLRIIKKRQFNKRKKFDSQSDGLFSDDANIVYTVATDHTPFSEASSFSKDIHIGKVRPSSSRGQKKKKQFLSKDKFVPSLSSTSSPIQDPIYNFPSFEDAKALSMQYNKHATQEDISQSGDLFDSSRISSRKPKVIKVLRRKKLRENIKSRQFSNTHAPVFESHSIFHSPTTTISSAPNSDPFLEFHNSQREDESGALSRGLDVTTTSPVATTFHPNVTKYRFQTTTPISESSLKDLSHEPHFHSMQLEDFYLYAYPETSLEYTTSSSIPQYSTVTPDSPQQYIENSTPKAEYAYNIPESSSLHSDVTTSPRHPKYVARKVSPNTEHKKHSPRSSKKSFKASRRFESHYSSGSEQNPSIINYNTPQEATHYGIQSVDQWRSPRGKYIEETTQNQYIKNPWNKPNTFSKSQWDNSFTGQYNSIEDDGGFNGIPGIAGKDYPTLDSMPKTKFSCSGRGPGYYADVDSGCQMFHVCDLTIHSSSFLCPNGTLFNDNLQVCDWWNNVNCGNAFREPPMGHHTYESHVKEYDDRVILPYLEDDPSFSSDYNDNSLYSY